MRAGSGVVGGGREGYAGVMTFADAGRVRGSDLRRLLESRLPDPVLVLVGGRIEVVAGGSDGLELISREEFLRREGRTGFTDAELAQRAATLSSAVDNLGG